MVTNTINRRQLKFCHVPCEFQRRPRSFRFMGVFKATEFRTFLCYTSPVVLKNVFGSHVIYDHYMCLVVSMRIFLSKLPTDRDVRLARKCIRTFVERFPSIYGEGGVVYNVHSVLHIPDDFDRFGSLDLISSFPFESYLQVLKRFIKRGGHELEQVVKRIHEKSNFKSQTPTTTASATHLRGEHVDGPTGAYNEDDVTQYSEVVFSSRTFKLNSRNNAVFFEREYGLIVNILKLNDGHVVFLVKQFRRVFDVFSYPCSSSRVGIVFAQSLSDCLVPLHIREVSKCWCIKWSSDKYCIMRLLHESH